MMRAESDDNERNNQMLESAGIIEVSIVMPCLNEAETLKGCIEEALSGISNGGMTGEVVIGDNGSTDGSQEIAEECGARVVNIAPRGYGAALDGAIREAKGQFIIMGDADGSYNFSNLMIFIQKLRNNTEIVMGNRFKGSILPGAMPWKNRYIGNPVLSGIGRLLFSCPVSDLHCGIRGFSKECYLRLNLQTTGMEFASEMVIKAALLGFKMSEVPVVLRPDGRSRPPHLRPWRDGWRHLRFMLLFSPWWLFLYPGISLFLIGLAGMVALGRGPFIMGSVVFDINTLLFCAGFVLIGFQAISFALLTKVYVIREGLHPPEPKLDCMFRYVNLETGLVVGSVVAGIGIVMSAAAVWSWSNVSFGVLNPSETLRIVIPGVTCLALGAETILVSLLASALGLRLKGTR